MDLFLRKVNHSQARDSYRVVKDNGDEIEIDSGPAYRRLGVAHRLRDPDARR
jgi:hypothetical protein